MDDIGIVTTVLIIAKVFISLRAFKDYALFDSWSFHVQEILVKKDYKRMLTSGFIHTDGRHLFFNMFSLFLFAQLAEDIYGPAGFSLIYFGSLITGSLLSLWLNRNNLDYKAVGASGAVSGIIFAAIALNPGKELPFFMISFFDFPAWAFAIAYILYSMYGIGRKGDGIGHEAHLGGALGGVLLAIALQPNIVSRNPVVLALMVIPALIFLYLKYKGNGMVTSGFLQKKAPLYNVDDRFNDEKKNQEKELNTLLEKINMYGMASLSETEKRRLKELSDK